MLASIWSINKHYEIIDPYCNKGVGLSHVFASDNRQKLLKLTLALTIKLYSLKISFIEKT